MYDAEARAGAEALVAARFQPLNMLFPIIVTRAGRMITSLLCFGNGVNWAQAVKQEKSGSSRRTTDENHLLHLSPSFLTIGASSPQISYSWHECLPYINSSMNERTISGAIRTA